jgi:hypothetical protein
VRGLAEHVGVTAPWDAASRRRPYWGELGAHLNEHDAAVFADIRRVGVGRPPLLLRARWASGGNADAAATTALTLTASALVRGTVALAVEAAGPVGGSASWRWWQPSTVRVGARWQPTPTTTLAAVVTPAARRFQAGAVAALPHTPATAAILCTHGGGQTRVDVGVTVRTALALLPEAGVQLARVAFASGAAHWHAALSGDLKLGGALSVHLRLLVPVAAPARAAVRASITVEPD